MKRRLVRIVRVFVSTLALSAIAILARAYYVAHSEMPYNAAKAGILSLEMKIQAFHIDTHALPRTLQDLLAPGNFEGWNGPYAKERDIVDPWGRPISYELLDPTRPAFRLGASPHNNTPGISETYEPSSR